MNIIESFSYTEKKIDIMKELENIARREGKKKSEFIVSILEEYVKTHAAGNTTFRLDNWQENPEFQAVPTLFTSYDKWKDYVDSSTSQDKRKLLKSMTEKRNYLCARL